MYHCHTQFYLIGHQRRILQILQEIPPLAAFQHSFTASDSLEITLSEQADVLLADLRDLQTDASALIQFLKQLSNHQKPDAEIILLLEKPQISVLLKTPEFFANISPDNPQTFSENIRDIWTLPLSESELRYRFQKWQRDYKTRQDNWETHQFLEVSINSSPDLVWYKTKDGIHEKVNDSFCKTVGKSKDQVEGRGHAYIWDVEEDDPSCIESESIVMESQETCVFDEVIQAGGESKILKTYKSPLYDRDGSVMGTVGIAIDVTQERIYAQEIIQKKQELEKIFTTMNCGVICHSLDGSRILSINQAALYILGYDSLEELEQDHFYMISRTVLEEDRPKLWAGIESLKKEGDSVSIDYRIQHRDGKILHVMGNFTLVEENGELYCQRSLLDCTAQKAREEKQRIEKERVHMELIHALSIEYNLVCSFNLDTGTGKLLRMNDCPHHILEQIFSDENLSLEDCINRYINTAVHEEDRALMREAATSEWLEKELANKDICHINYRTICCGETRYFQLKAVRAGTWDESRGIVLGLRSIDEETREEREQKALLENALSQANRASRAKSTFLSNMSHDIRTPMNAIIGFTTLALTHIDRREQVEEYLKKIMTSGNHLLSLINDVLDMSRIESGKIRLEEQPCSLPDILHGLRSIIQADVHAKQLDLYIDAIDIQDEDIFCDRLRLNQVLLNLLSNAVKYTPSGGQVCLKVIEKPGAPKGKANYEFHVKDNGIGMNEEFVKHIFEPFERERNSTISGIQGTGLGMAITKNIVDMMNGAIEVRSKQNVGTECIVAFTFRLHPGKKETHTISELQGLRALVVDDDFNTCDSVSWMLQQIGLRAEWTLSGKEAVLRTRQAVMRGDQYSVYIIDWLLPDMNGVEVARRIRQETGSEVPIIILTAYDWADIEDEALEAGVTAFCSKPLFQSELRDCLQSVVQRQTEQKTEQTQESQVQSDDGKSVIRTGRILLVEDNELNREIAITLLEEAGFTVETAENGAEAVEILREAEAGYYQLTLMDVQMPVMNGYEATRIIRDFPDQKKASIPILAMTANAFEEDRQEALRSGMDGHIVKPIDVDKLMNTLDQILKKSQA